MIFRVIVLCCRVQEWFVASNLKNHMHYSMMINRTRRKKMCHIASFYCLVVLQNGLLHAHMFPAWTSLVTVNSKRYGIMETSHCPRDQGFLSDVTTLAEKRPSRLRLITYTGWGHSTTGPLGDCEPQVASAAKPSMLTLLFFTILLMCMYDWKRATTTIHYFPSPYRPSLKTLEIELSCMTAS